MKPNSAPADRTAEAAGWLKRRRDCRLCGAGTDPVLSLRETPLANAFVRPEQAAEPQPRFPLTLRLCRACAHLQLEEIVSPEILFRDYVYVSGTSPAFVDHFRRYARAVIERAELKPGDQVIDIGSNDGTLLRFFQEAGMRVLGLDPARKIAESASKTGIPTRTEFFTPELARALKREGWKPKVITANNVFAHADDLDGIARGIAELLDPAGWFLFEVSHGLAVVEKLLFDTIYHEHLSYHTARPLAGFFESRGWVLADAEKVETHGGSLRGWVRPKRAGIQPAERLHRLIREEERAGLFKAACFQKLGDRIHRRKEELRTLLDRLKNEGRRVIGFGAPAKATTLMYQFELGPADLPQIIDDSPWKQGLLSPGHHIPIVSSEVLRDPRRRPDHCLILAWNFAEPIIAKQVDFRAAGGHFIVPLPELEVR
ncbi:MAG: SAM-dependent methyltransferase [Candidatus Omnitrophica bacterium CG11_big_fil_rev_8_21_14_0_20_64_10]|nr:MAG: SAM-dependent methyltransferase [Candidatus Omnitrophica bacterium CG11_big_fil_rev_8_21_14_0_20_64_10]